MPKAIAHPADNRLLERNRQHLVEFAQRNALRLRSATLGRSAGRYTHANQFKRMRKSLKTLRTKVGRVYRAVEIKGTQILRSDQRRGINKSLRTLIHRLSAIEAIIVHMKSNDRLQRKPLKGEFGDALYAVLCDGGQNICWLALLCRVHSLGHFALG